MKIIHFDYKKKEFTLTQGKKKEKFPIKNLEDSDLEFLKIISTNEQVMFSSDINHFCDDMDDNGFNFEWVEQDFFINSYLLIKKGKHFLRETPKGFLKFKRLDSGFLSFVKMIPNK